MAGICYEATRDASAAPRLISARMLANQCGISYWRLLRRVASGSIKPDFQSVHGDILFRANRMDEIKVLLGDRE